MNESEISLANSPKIIKRFFDKVKKTDTCWNWTASWLGHGYGGFWMNGKMEKSNRTSWMIHNGDIPNFLFVLHRCDNKLCVRPEHLFLGTHKDNMDDKIAKGRCSSGENHGMAKFKESQIREIRFLYKTIKSQRKIAKMFKTSQPHIQEIVNFKIWKNVH